MIEGMFQANFVDIVAKTLRDPPKETNWARDLASRFEGRDINPTVLQTAAKKLVDRGGKAFPRFAACIEAIEAELAPASASGAGQKLFVLRGSAAWEHLTSQVHNGRRRSYPVANNEQGEAGWWIDRQTVLATGLLYSVVERRPLRDPSELLRRAAVAARWREKHRPKTPESHLRPPVEPLTPNKTPVSVSKSLAASLASPVVIGDAYREPGDLEAALRKMQAA
jgi:hypothetical protein